MNDNNFDSNRSEPQEPKSSDVGFDVYSKHYTPGDDGYVEHKSRYSSAPPTNGGNNGHRPPRRGGNSRILVILAVTLAVLLLCSAVAFVAARVAFSHYDALYQEHLEALETQRETQAETEPDQSKQTETQEPETEPETEAETELIFSSDEDTEIEKSDTPAVTVGGAVGDEGLSVADVAALVADSVVEITTSETLYNGIAYDSGAGSGVIVTEGGVIITNNHVVESAGDIAVRLTNGNVYKAVLVAADAEADIAILKITPEETLTVAKYGDSDKLVVGEEVVAIGNPLGVLGGTVTNGIISALEREVTIDGETMTLLQHNAAISPGNSGGALFNMRGELVGIVNAKSSTTGAEGLGFAIPMNTVIEVYEDLVEFGYVKGRADHGLILTTDRYYFFQSYIYIYSSRYTDELRYGDRLLAIGGHTPTSIDEAYVLLDRYEIGDTVEIIVARNGKQVSVTLEIREYTPQN